MNAIYPLCFAFSLSFSVSARLAKPDAGRDGTVVPYRRSGSVRYYVFIVHECCQRRVRRWWVAADCGLRDGLAARKLLG